MFLIFKGFEITQDRIFQSLEEFARFLDNDIEAKLEI